MTLRDKSSSALKIHVTYNQDDEQKPEGRCAQENGGEDDKLNENL